MPAVTADTANLTRIQSPVEPTERSVKSVTTAPFGFEGEGFPVRRAFQGVSLRELDPFIHMDQMGEVEHAPGEPKGTPWHPHRGFETVTYMIDGTFEHHDSTGGGGLIANGATQWMTAGSGLLHIEKPPEDLVIAGGLFHGLQLWVNLPAGSKWTKPNYQNLEPGDVRLLSTPDGETLIRLIAGDLGGESGPGSTYTPIAMLHATLRPGARMTLPWRQDFNALAYVLSGSGTAGSDGASIEAGQLVIFNEGNAVTISASTSQEGRSPALDVVVLGGLPIGEPVVAYGPFVMNTRGEVMQAMDDFHAGKLGQIPGTA